MKIKRVIILVFMMSFFHIPKSAAQKFSAFKDLGGAEKLWVLLHPFSAKRAYTISKDVDELSKQMIDNGELDGDGAGGKVDAFRHAYWMALLTIEIGPARARWLGKAHEKKNRKDFEEGKLEEGVIPDKVSKEMDLFNNEIGIKIGEENLELEHEKIKEIVFDKIERGEMLIIKKDQNNNSLDVEGNIIPKEEWEGKWENNRVLVPSNYKAD